MNKKIVTEGQGPVCPPGATVLAHYRGTLENGKQFDSSYDRNEPFQFKVGQGQVIKCWDQGFQQMKQGEKAILTCPPEYAYGARGVPGTIPPKATLLFEVELLAFRQTRL
ncbi:hypothetical protein FGO68_gene12452 [Halteria grandinella]|uniref:peptidylprolyl isomerase n=1 Tax=Halteria grandinella TaxID=5974 RepID=A0A8J8NI25_HALGN|nr:hypothetical protein FGO68_gene12452 [Halteria grandinella]